MPAIYANRWARDNSSSSEPAPGGRVSINGGADKRGIVAMILATLLFIAVLIFYQYMAIVMARREAQPHPSPMLEKMESRTSIYFRWLLEKAKALFFIVKHVMTRESKVNSDRSSIDSGADLLGSSSRRQAGRRSLLGFSCATRGKHYPRSKREPRNALRPLLLSKRIRNEPRSPIDDKTQEFLRSPHAFDFDDIPSVDFDEASGHTESSSSRHRRSRHNALWVDEPIRAPERPAGAVVVPVDIRKKTKDHGREDLAVSLGMPSPSVLPFSSYIPLSLHSPQKACFGDTKDPLHTHRRKKFLSVIPDEQGSREFHDYTEEDDSDGEEDVYRKLIQSSSPRPTSDEMFTIGDLSDSDRSSDGSGH